MDFRTGSKNSIDMSWLIQKLKAVQEQQDSPFYTVGSVTDITRCNIMRLFNKKDD